MIATVIAWFYISLLCWLWGTLIIILFKKTANEPGFVMPHFSILCMAGLAGITAFAGILSLFIPLGTWVVQLVIAVPCLYLFTKQGVHRAIELKKQMKGLHPAIFFLLIVSCLMVLVISSWKIIHPDTLAYHSQVIQWMEKYKVVPGLVHLEQRLGLQNYWFIACALFSFKFTGIAALTFINSVLLFWYFIFIAYKINKAIYEPGRITGAFLWLLLLGLSIAGITQVRLTAASANPDFIAVLYVWLVLYLFVKYKNRNKSAIHSLLIIFLSVFAVTIKFSVIPILIAAAYAGIRLLQEKNSKAVLLSVFIVVLILVPLFVRNIITSGYPAFPSPVPDITNVEWKYDKEKTILLKKFITGYARGVRSFSTEEIIAGDDLKLHQWLPGWWKRMSLPDQFIFMILAISFVAAIVSVKKIVRSETEIPVALVISATGIIFWFIQAPDPRFGFGFILGFPAIIAGLLLPSFSRLQKHRHAGVLLLIAIITAGIFISSYTAYRFSNFFERRQIMLPLGIELLPSEKIQCNGHTFNLAINREACGDISVPCVLDSCVYFVPRGNLLTDGFNAK